MHEGALKLRASVSGLSSSSQPVKYVSHSVFDVRAHGFTAHTRPRGTLIRAKPGHLQRQVRHIGLKH